ncbi:MAG: monovalent cation:proton antiporter-2 (CPA2) family protein [Pseudomonadales bacterium]|nr:monovalent cation:proton antiporter-2 (CPA2) family protein [Pseudomonadales bacterium]
MDMLYPASIMMAAAVLVVPISKKFGFGSILGYVLAGLVIGPWGLNLIRDSQSILHFSEIGVVFLLFIIGLELQPSRLWLLRKAIFIIGSAQVLLTTLTITAITGLFVNSWTTACVIGFGLSLSSTAFALQLLAERQDLATPHGRSALHILLFQDIAVIPVLALIPLAAINEIDGQAIALGAVSKTIAIIAAFWLFTRYLLRPALRFVASARIHEVFTAAALLLVLGTALLMHSIGVSMALGAFMAGVLVADSEYRHQLEADIKPFKGLLLGLFFMSVGMSANLSVFAEQAVIILLIVAGLILVKSIILSLIARVAKLKSNDARRLGLYLSQGGEFGFILYTLAADYYLLPVELKDLLVVAVTLSMVMTPLILLLHEQIMRRISGTAEVPVYDTIDTTDSKVILAGFGRFGQIISRILRTQHIRFTAIEIDPGHVDFVRRLGNKVYYGDASNKKLLEVANTKNAEVFVLAVGNIEKSIKIAELVRREFPNARLFARARTRKHEMRLRALGAEMIIRDTLLSSMYLAEKILIALGLPSEQAMLAKERFYTHDCTTLDKQFAYREDQQMLIQTSREAATELEQLFSEDELEYAKVIESTGEKVLLSKNQ